MVKTQFLKFLRNQAIHNGKYVSLWKKLNRPSLEDWTEYLRRHGRFKAMGENCALSPDNHFGDPNLISIGNNVRIAGAFLSCHDGSVNMLNHAFNKKLDNVGPIKIRNNVYIGYGAIILPNVEIGSNAIVAAGSVVTRDVPENTVVAGSPAKPVSSLDHYIQKLENRNYSFPWRVIIEQREGEFDPVIEPELTRMRVEHFYGQAV